MTPVPSRTRRLRALLGAGVGTVLVVLACETPLPVADRAAGVVLAESQVDVPPSRLSGGPLRIPRCCEQPRIEGQVMVEFVVDAAGLVDSASIVVISSTHKAFERPAVDVAKSLRFRPAMAGGVPRAVRLRQPVEFHIMKPATAPSTTPARPGSVDTTLVFLTGAPTTDTLAVVVTPGRIR